MFPVQAALHLSHFKGTETVEKVLFQFLITKIIIKMVLLESNVHLDPACLGPREMGCPAIKSKPPTRFSLSVVI